MNSGKAIKGFCQVICSGFNPRNGLLNLQVLQRQVMPMPDRFVMKYPIPQSAYFGEVCGQIVASALAARHVWKGRF